MIKIDTTISRVEREITRLGTPALVIYFQTEGPEYYIKYFSLKPHALYVLDNFLEVCGLPKGTEDYTPLVGKKVQIEISYESYKGMNYTRVGNIFTPISPKGEPNDSH